MAVKRDDFVLYAYSTINTIGILKKYAVRETVKKMKPHVIYVFFESFVSPNPLKSHVRADTK